MTRDYERAPRGERAVGPVPPNSGTVTTMIGALDIARHLWPTGSRWGTQRRAMRWRRGRVACQATRHSLIAVV
jgi:hypothetical protein